MIFRFSKIFYGASWVLKSAVWPCPPLSPRKWPIFLNSSWSNWWCPKISKVPNCAFTYLPIPITLISKRAFGAWRPYLKWIFFKWGLDSNLSRKTGKRYRPNSFCNVIFRKFVFKIFSASGHVRWRHYHIRSMLSPKFSKLKKYVTCYINRLQKLFGVHL